jgi:uncharacterized protein (TIGR02145 family)
MSSIKGSFIFLFLGALVILTAGCEKVADKEIQKGTVSDFEGNVYPTVLIGNQWWMAKNLKATKYNNGDQISTTAPVTLSIVNETSPKYQWAYLGNEGLAAIYGRLYTWNTVMDTRNICPTGWHLPSDTEWTTLTDYLISNGYGFQGSGDDIAKSMASTSGWLLHGIVGVPGNDQASNNSSGFTSLPGGIREPIGDFLYAGGDSYFWSSTENSATSAWYRIVDFDQFIIPRDNVNKKAGLSVRCLKD